MISSFLTALGSSRVYPITDRLISGHSHSQQISRLSEQGATLIQLREKVLSASEFYIEAAEAVDVARQLGVKVIINDRVDIALALHADGVHLGQDDLPPEAARRVLGPNAIIGISTHNLEQAHFATQMPVDYVAIGPVFPTITKESPNLSLGFEGVNAAREVVKDLPLVAIGGITAANSQAVLAAGADAVAIISDIWRSASPNLAFPS